MRPERFTAAELSKYLHIHQIATLEELKTVLGTPVNMTVFRKLRQLSYLSSYSHRGRFYTLAELARFDQRGLWTCRGVHFSRFGSLVDTVEHFVTRSERGLLASELAEELEVEVKEPLFKLVTAGRLTRMQISGLYLYCAADPLRQGEQLRERNQPARFEPSEFLRDRVVPPDETKAAIILFFSTLDERQRRLYAGVESLRLGHGGDRRIAELTGLDVHTIAKGRRELFERDQQVGRIRRPGGGRKAVEKKRPRSSPRSKP